MSDKVDGYVQLLTLAIGLGGDLYDTIRDVVKGHAQDNLTVQEYADLESRWSADKLRAAANAGIDPATGKPYGEA